MSRETGISWTDHTWNPWEGCTKVSPGCGNCYMYELVERYGRDPSRVRRTNTWREAERWNEEARRAGRIDKVFTCSLSDFFHEAADAWRPEAWELIRRCRHLQFQILTKRPLLIRDRLPPDWGEGYPNVWLGVSIESDDYVWRADVLRAIPARVRWVSAEPLLGPLPDLDLTGFQWIVVGGESGPGYRDMDHAWARQLRDRANAQGVAFFFKQSAGPRPGRGDLLDGRRWQEFPSTPGPSDETAAGCPVERDLHTAGEDGQQGRKTEGVQAEEERASEHLNATPERDETPADPLPRKDEAEAVLSVTWEETRIREANHTEECQRKGHAGCQLLTPRVLCVELETIPTCCLKDRMQRASWWNEIENQLVLIVDLGFVTDTPVPWYPDGRSRCLASLAQKVPYPTRAEMDEYRVWTKRQLRRQEDERQRQEDERQRRQEELQFLRAERDRQQQEIASLRGELQRQGQEMERTRANWASLNRQEKEKRVMAEQAAGRWQRLADMARRDADVAWKLYTDLLTRLASAGFARQAGGGIVPLSVHLALAVLGLRWPCTRNDVTAAYRKAALKHHSDRGGDNEEFLKAKDARDKIMKAFDSLGVL